MFQRRFLVSRMREIFLTGCLVLWSAPDAPAQALPNFELFGGYTFVRPEGGQADLHGGYAGFAKPVNPWLEVVAELSRLSGSQTLSVAGPADQMIDVVTDVTFVSVGGGPRLTHRGERLSPFVHALFGLARATWQGPLSTSGGETSFATAVGAGVDATLGRHVSFRLFQVEYVATRFGEAIENNFRIASGLTFSF